MLLDTHRLSQVILQCFTKINQININTILKFSATYCFLLLLILAMKIMSALVDITSSLDGNQDEYLEKIENMLFRMFKMIYLQRFDDTLPEIRVICLEEILIWIEKFHQVVLDDKYLKFIGKIIFFSPYF